MNTVWRVHKDIGLLCISLKSMSASHFSELATTIDPLSRQDSEFLTSDVTPFLDEHLREAFTTVCECYLIHEGRIVAPDSACFLTIHGPRVNRDHESTESLSVAVEMCLRQDMGIALENGVHKVASFVTIRQGQRHTVHLFQGNVTYFDHDVVMGKLRSVPVSEVIAHARFISPMRHITSYTSARVTLLRCMKIYHALDLQRDDSVTLSDLSFA